MKLFVASILAWHHENGMEVSPRAIVAETQELAELEAMNCAMSFWPEADGWHLHQRVVTECVTNPPISWVD